MANQKLFLEVRSGVYCQYQADSCTVCVGHSSEADARICTDNCSCHEK
ncbi:MAG: hypothetical protein NTV77_03110 [Candidatus Azambacteria bacterium]|nr:hypothetical protein [Candidatus Azambacteria bacterium]